MEIWPFQRVKPLPRRSAKCKVQTKRRHTHIFCSKSQLKKSDEDEALSEGDEPPKKSSKPSAAAVDNDSDDSDHIVVYELSKNRKVSVRSWNGRVVVDIREFYYKDGKEMPGKKEDVAFAFLKADSDGDYITFSGFCEALRQIHDISDLCTCICAWARHSIYIFSWSGLARQR
ncbi:PC4 domain-containing protein [Forsythia ovata]|uniref:PC4 domain-containing protein n=1 Tax=Forsythia ovata TaxID=205694 RepID=A0ABD1U4C8_9LAMI